MKITLILTSIFLIGSLVNVNAQLIGGKKNKNAEIETDGKAQFTAQVQENRLAARKALVPFKYSGVKSSNFAYKTFTSTKEIEILTIEKTDYRLSFDGTGIVKDPIIVRIYDKPSTFKSRVLLHEEKDVDGSPFVVEVSELNEIFRQSKKDYYSGTITNEAELLAKHKMVEKMRLKKVYVEYVIPAVEREISVSEEESIGATKQSTSYEMVFGGMVVAVGYKAN